MEIPDCSFADLKEPASAKKDNKRTKDFEHSDDNPELQKLKKVWKTLINEYQVGLLDYFQVSPALK